MTSRFNPAADLRAALLAALACLVPAHAKDAAPAQVSEFGWRATLNVPQGASAAQIHLPADAMLQFKSASRSDLRVFNGNGEAVPATLIASPVTLSAIVRTPAFPALPLLAATAGQPLATGALRMQMSLGGDRSTIWVQVGGDTGTQAPSTTQSTARSIAPALRLPAVLLDTRRATQTISALDLDAMLPANTLVSFTLAHSSDLLRWTPVSVKGPLFWFEGSGAPRNTTLELEQPLNLENQYLRLTWDASAQVQVTSAIGMTAPSHKPAAPVRAPLKAGVVEDGRNWTWPVTFAAPMTGLYLQTARANTLLPVRVLGRNDAAEPWRLLGQGLVYRGTAANPQNTNAAIPLHGATPRWLRVEATHGMALPDAELTAQAEFNPHQLVFLASGPAPFQLAVGRPQTSSALVDAAMLRAVVPGALDAVPTATIESVQVQDLTPWSERLLDLLPGGSSQRKIILWLVLGAGVLILGAVAFTLLRQLSAKPDGVPAASNQTLS